MQKVMSMHDIIIKTNKVFLNIFNYTFNKIITNINSLMNNLLEKRKDEL